MRPARSHIAVLPTALTLGNLVCGFVAMAKVVDATTGSGGEGPFDPLFAAKILDACWLIFLGMVFDALDGRIARMTGQASALGGLLDSLSDVVTFGAAPALIAKAVYEHGKTVLEQPFVPKVITALVALYLICAALRLARFTATTSTDESSHQLFQGLPSPAAAGLIVSACLFIFSGRHEIGVGPATADALALYVLRGLPWLAGVLGLLMISTLPYVHVVQRYVGSRTRTATFVRMVFIVAFVVLFHEWALFLAALVYVLGGILLAVRARITGRPAHEHLPEPWAEDESLEETFPGNGGHGDGDADGPGSGMGSSSTGGAGDVGGRRFDP